MALRLRLIQAQIQDISVQQAHVRDFCLQSKNVRQEIQGMTRSLVEGTREILAGIRELSDLRQQEIEGRDAGAPRAKQARQYERRRRRSERPGTSVGESSSSELSTMVGHGAGQVSAPGLERVDVQFKGLDPHTSEMALVRDVA